MIRLHIFDSRPYLNIVWKILRAKCRVLGDMPCIRRMPSYDLNVPNLWKLAVAIDTSSLGHLEKGILLTPSSPCPTLWRRQSLSSCKQSSSWVLPALHVFPLLLGRRENLEPLVSGLIGSCPLVLCVSATPIFMEFLICTWKNARTVPSARIFFFV